ncbi:MAG: response regulator [Lachnospiraceae bacterium]|nr:response regulator [Lachnospiraceae bacterium]
MNLIAVDDEKLALRHLVHILEDMFPKDVTKGFQDQIEALTYAKELTEKNETLEFAFLDIEMYGMSGIELARQFKEICPGVKILFVTGHDNYALEAFRLHARGYILKPVTKELIEEEMQNIEGYSKEEREQKQQEKKTVLVKTFGNFDVFANEEPLQFSRSKAKELFAFLVDKKGTGVNTAEISSVLWEDKIYDRNLRSQTQTVISQMIKTLKAAGVEECVIKKWNYLAIDPGKIDCDYYNFLAGDVNAINSYTGEYMSNYSWAEFTTAFLDENIQNRRN